MPPRRPSLWVEIALALGLITLTTILLNAGVFWLIMKQAEEHRRTALAEALTSGIGAQLAASGADGPRPGEVLAGYRDASLAFDALYLVRQDLTPVHVAEGKPPDKLDDGLRAALYGRERHVAVEGAIWGLRAVEVTAPVVLRGERAVALRVRLPLASPTAFGSPSTFVLAYTASTGFAIAAFGFSLLRRRLIAPVAQVREGTRRIADGEFGHQLDVDASEELAALCRSLNEMSLALADYRQRTAEQVERLRRANDDLKTAQDALIRSERLAGVGRLAAGLAHEVGNPLAAVLGFVELLEQDLGDPGLESDLLRRTRGELERIHRIIRELLDYSRPGTGEVEMVQVGALVDEVRSTARHAPRFRDVELVEASLSEPVERAVVAIERDRLQQVLVNILLNAADAVREGGGGRVWLDARLVDGEVQLRCRDDGPGFSAVALERALEPFFTTKEPGRGTGLGLATSLQMVQAAGGRLELANASEGGALVTVVLPVAEAAAE